MNTLVYLDNKIAFIITFLEYLFLNNYIFFNVLIVIYILYITKITNFNKLVWWAQMGLNHRPHAYQACALTS